MSETTRRRTVTPKAPRVNIPKAIQETILKEWNHRCAICGYYRPQIHHIDEDPSNNVLENLIPLCPNCHLIDQHNPTKPIEPRVMSLFRLYKDPTILSPQFEPLFLRYLYLHTIPTEPLSVEEANTVEGKALYNTILFAVNDLVRFIKALEMGDYYSNLIGGLLRVEGKGRQIPLNDEGLREQLERQYYAEDLEDLRSKLCRTRPLVEKYLVELLRYQSWRGNPKRRSSRASEEGLP